MHKFLYQWCIIHLHFLWRRCMSTREVRGMGIVLQKKRFIVSQMVIFSKEPPDTAGHFRSAVVPLTGLYVGKLIYELLVYYKLLVPVCPWRFIFMLSDSLGKETGHFKMWIPQQGGDSQTRCHYLCQKRAVAIARQYIGVFTLAKVCYKCQRLAGMKWKIWCKYFCFARKCLSQCLGKHATARSKETVKKKYLFCHCCLFVIKFQRPILVRSDMYGCRSI